MLQCAAMFGSLFPPTLRVVLLLSNDTQYVYAQGKGIKSIVCV